MTFTSWQLTERAHEEFQRCLAGRKAQVYASVPDFNEREVAAWNHVTKINVPSYGVHVPAAVYELFNRQELQDIARQLGVPTLTYRFDPFVYSKAHKARQLIIHLRDLAKTSHPECAPVADKLDRFLTTYEALCPDKNTDPAGWAAFHKLGPAGIRSATDWHSFLTNCGVPADWQDRLSYDEVLQMFGASRSLSQAIQATPLRIAGKETNYRKYSFRWLSKILCSYEVGGCITDVLNLIYTMMQRDGSGHTEQQIAQTVREFTGKLQNRTLEGLLIPEYYAHDAETDDILCWVLLEHLRSVRHVPLHVIVQLPVSDELDGVERLLCAGRHYAFRDPDSRNLEVLKKTYNVTEKL